MISNVIFEDMIEAPVRAFRGRVELYEGSTLTKICGCHDSLKSFTIERIGNNNFFGYGICQKINAKLIDNNREIEVSTANYIEAVFGKDNNYIYAFPKFEVTDVYRDENTNEISITAYDSLYRATTHTVSELGLNTGYSIREFAGACASLLGLPINTNSIALSAFDTRYEYGANFDGTETIREALDAIAQATQTIYYINNNWELVFKRLDRDGEPVLTIDREKYITLDSGSNRRLTKITHATELGDNVSADLGISGTTQYIRNNPFWDTREDIGVLVDNALAAIGGLTINQFECEWRENFLLEIGDKIALITKDKEKVISYLLNDTIEFDGSLYGNTNWEYNEDEANGTDNPVSLGDALKQTYARVDKANKKIDIVASDTASNKDAIAALQVNTESITASVSKIETDTNEAFSSLNDEIATLTSSVEAKVSAEDIALTIKNEMANGVDKVVTSTGFVFDETGLSVSRTDSEMTTTITEDGMKVFKDDTTVLTANNVGVDAANLHATTYLIIGTNSRFENYGEDRTGCFWIGGNY